MIMPNNQPKVAQIHLFPMSLELERLFIELEDLVSITRAISCDRRVVSLQILKNQRLTTTSFSNALET
jgi:hypothetical protein